MKHAGKLLVHLMVVITVCAGWAGGEIGNGFTDFENTIGGFSIAYPRDWNYLSTETSVSFAQVVGLDAAPVLTVMQRSFGGVKDLDGLFIRLQLLHKDRAWTSVEINGKHGFETNDGVVGYIYLLQRQEMVVGMRYQVSVDEITAKKLEFMIKSVQID